MSIYYLIEEIVTNQVKNKFCLNELKNYFMDENIKGYDINKMITFTQKIIDRLEIQLENNNKKLMKMYKKDSIKLIKSCKSKEELIDVINKLNLEFVKNMIETMVETPNFITKMDLNQQIVKIEADIQHLLQFQNFLLPHIWTNFYLYKGYIETIS